MTERIVECCEHGSASATFVCRHIIALGAKGETDGFNAYPDGTQEFPDAWCDQCEAFLNSKGGDWNDESEAFAGVSLLCSECYRKFQALAEAEGKLRLN